ncbi:hypothetical protein NDU88_002775 [Pleurodeles waltl]|uniref:Uncharacterized protein n=1 Tax=Pleurodeles waltl TaxID=8319 RepID=A0AAV7RDQ8_PLEWA|nr:hypothetical protein NDU88_002775 [Pleurodeles waltl]
MASQGVEPVLQSSAASQGQGRILCCPGASHLSIAEMLTCLQCIWQHVFCTRGSGPRARSATAPCHTALPNQPQPRGRDRRRSDPPPPATSLRCLVGGARDRCRLPHHGATDPARSSPASRLPRGKEPTSASRISTGTHSGARSGRRHRTLSEGRQCCGQDGSRHLGILRGSEPTGFGASGDDHRD